LSFGLGIRLIYLS